MALRRLTLLLALALGCWNQVHAQGTASTPPWPQPTPQLPPAAELAAPMAPAVEARGIWIEMKTLPRTEEGVRKLVRSLARCNFNLLLVEVTYEGTTLYPSALTSQDPRFAGFDALTPLIDEAHRHQMEVHAWMWVMKQARWRAGEANPGGPILATHPQWIARNQQGLAVSPGSSYYWVCPSRRDAREHLLALLEEVAVRYPVDGVHLDYIRFERTLTRGSPPPYCFCDACRQEYCRAGGADPVTFEPYTRPFLDWLAWRERLVDAFVAEAYTRLKQRRPSLMVSAAVYPDPEAARRYFSQNWDLWLRNRWLDYITPMLYRDQTDGFVRRLRAYERDGQTRHAVLLPGVGVNEIQNRIFSHDVLIEQVLATRSQGMAGLVLFSYSVMTPYFEQFLINKAFPRPARLPFREPAQAAALLLDQARSFASGEQQDVAVSGRPLPDTERIIAWLQARATDLMTIAGYRAAELAVVPATPPPLTVPARYKAPPQVALRVVDEALAPRVDGVASDAAWKQVPALSLATDEKGQPAQRATWARLVSTSDTLYVLLTCEEPSLPAAVLQAGRKRRGLVEADAISVFVDPGPSRSNYLVFNVDVLGRQTLEVVPDGRHRPGGVSTAANVPSRLEGWQAAVHRSAGRWSVELAIPLRPLVAARGGGFAEMGLNLLRRHWSGARHERTMWSPTYGDAYCSSRFGVARWPEAREL